LRPKESGQRFVGVVGDFVEDLVSGLLDGSRPNRQRSWLREPPLAVAGNDRNGLGPAQRRFGNRLVVIEGSVTGANAAACGGTRTSGQTQLPAQFTGNRA
jgi:hypothetical protein